MAANARMLLGKKYVLRCDSPCIPLALRGAQHNTASIKPESASCWKADAGSGSWLGVLAIEPGFGLFHQLHTHPSSFPLTSVWVTVTDRD